MDLSPGTRLGPYEISARIGVGGMGEVYRATDRNLKREVAIKVLPGAFAADRERLARFEREAEVLASLNHPNIAAIYGLERTDNQTALVMELVEGQTLADRIAEGALPLEETLPIAKQIAEALEAAHEQGIVHRDLKPANVKLRPDGTVKLLDFGLAKATEPATMSPGLSQSPTITTPAMTQAGMILGTAAYMSPEQARGKAVDRRADIWAFGCVLYEMLTGRRAFEDEDVSLTLSKILQTEPAFEALPASTPAHVRQTLRLCLKKPLKDRLADIGAVRLALDGAFATATDATTAPSVPRTSTVWPRATTMLGVAIGAALVGGLLVWRLTPSPAPAAQTVTRFAIPASSSVAPGGAGTGRHTLAMSPDGTQLVYWADAQLHVRRLDSLDEAVPIRGTEEAREPFFSPDGKWIGFHQEGALKRVSVNGGAPVVVAATRNPWGATWDTDGIIRYGQGAEGIWQVSAAGGMPSQLIDLEPGEQAHGPQLLPGGEWVLFTFLPGNVDSWDQAQIVAQSLRTRERVILIQRGHDARYIPTGHLLYGSSGVLLAVPFDPGQRRATGAAVPLIEGVLDADTRTGAMHFTLSDSGSLVYLTGASSLRRRLTWVSREGRVEDVPAEALAYDAPRISPDGQRIAVNLGATDGPDVHVYDLVRKALIPVTASPVRGRGPLWTRDSKRVVFYSDHDGGGLYSKAVDGTGTVERLTTTRAYQTPYSWSRDGRTIVLEQRATDRTSPGDIYVLSLDGTGGATPLVQTPANEVEPAVSPDGRWLAYTSAEPRGRPEVYVRPFPNVDDGRWRISSDGGSSPLWSADGKQLFFISRDRAAVAVAVPIETEPTFRAGTPTTLFELPPYYGSFFALTTRQWDIAPDENRFLIVHPGDSAASERARMQIVVAINWLEELKRLVPTN